jgi:hypothetical protein
MVRVETPVGLKQEVKKKSTQLGSESICAVRIRATINLKDIFDDSKHFEMYLKSIAKSP